MKTKYTYLIIPFLKGFSLFIILSGLLGIFGCNSNTQTITDWKSALKFSPDDTANFKKIINDFNANDITQLKAVRLNKKLILFKMNSPSYCGYIGCLHIAYTKENGEYISVFKRYIYPYLPRNTTQIQLLKNPPNGIMPKSSLPCLRIFQANIWANVLEETTECFNGKDYQVVDESTSSL